MNASGVALLADIGGTHARFAIAEAGRTPAAPLALATADYSDFAEALADYRRRTGLAGAIAGAAVCVAGPVIAGRATLTNCDWELCVSRIREAVGGGECALVNDFTAVALSLTSLDEGALRKLGGGEAEDGAPKAVLGPGTGLGVSGLVRDARGGYAPVEGEGGHVDLAAANARERDILAWLQERHGHVSAERVLSGPGLRALYAALAALDGDEGVDIPASEEIARLAQRAGSPLAVEAVALFTAWLGAVAGDLALTLGARGGLYVAGGIVREWGTRFDAAAFRARFEAKGRFRSYLEEIPAWAITDPYPAFKGLLALTRGWGAR